MEIHGAESGEASAEKYGAERSKACFLADGGSIENTEVEHGLPLPSVAKRRHQNGLLAASSSKHGFWQMERQLGRQNLERHMPQTRRRTGHGRELGKYRCESAT